jgi:hypothetical protein
MSRLSTFFKDNDTEFGVFYPKHYLLAVFPNLAEADRAKVKLSNSGCLMKTYSLCPGKRWSTSRKTICSTTDSGE